MLREVGQRMVRPDVSILGAYHGENVGDMALGGTIQGLVDQFGATGGLQDLYCLHRQAIGDSIILGGGATGVESNVAQLAKEYGDMASRTAMVGMDFSGDIADFPSEALSYLQDVRFISCRSKAQTEKLADILQRGDVRFNYDNAFALEDCGSTTTSANRRVLGYNALNLFMTWMGDRFEPGSALEEWYRKVDSPILPYVRSMGPAYIRVVRRVLRVYRERGYRIAHIPFTPEDSLFARIYFRNQTDSFISYSSDVRNVTDSIARCDRLISTRYHSLVFGIKCRTPTIPVLYAVKCSDLLDDIGVGKEAGVERTDLVDETEMCVRKLVDGNPIVLGGDQLRDIREETRSTIEEAVRSVVR